MNQVVITGMGMMSPFGLGAETLYNNLVQGHSGITALVPPFQKLAPGYGGQVETTWKDLRDLPGAKHLRPSTMTRYTFLAAGGVADTLRAAGLDPETGDPDRRGLMIGSMCNMDNMDKYVRFPALVMRDEDLDAGRYQIDDSRLADAMRLFTGFEILRLMNNMPTAHAGIEAQCRGLCNTFLGSPVSGLQALGEAYRAISDGLVDQAIAGGVGSSSHELLLMTKGYRNQLSSKDSDPTSAGRPFDRAATGQLPGEAGAFFVLETAQSAKERGAQIFGEIVAYADRFSAPELLHGAPGPQASIAAARECFTAADWNPKQVDLVLPSAIGRPDMDRSEAQAITEVLSGAKPNWFSPVPYIGFTESASLPAALAVGLLAAHHHKLPANRNSEHLIDAWTLGARAQTTSETIERIWLHGFSPDGITASMLVTVPQT